MKTERFDLFYYTESNHHHPINDANAKCVEIHNVDDDGDYRFASVNEAIQHAIDNRKVAKGSARCGVTEVQTDEGIWTRVGPNKFARNQWSTWAFQPWGDE